MTPERARRACAPALVAILLGCGREPGSAREADGPDAATRDTIAWKSGTVSSPSTVQTGVATLIALRAGVHEGYERVTLELGGEGSGLPGYTVSYVDRPLHECASGREVHPVGDAWLEIRLEPLDAHSDGLATIPHTPQDLVGLANLKRVYLTCDFEAVTTLVLAAASPEPFRVLTLDAPRRIVVDVRR